MCYNPLALGEKNATAILSRNRGIIKPIKTL